MRKRFDRELYNEVDKKTKLQVMELLGNSKLNAVENPKKTKVDIEVFDSNDHVMNIECEVKRVWVGDKFPYESVQIPERKSKFAKLEKPTIFVMFNSDYSKYAVIKDTDLLSSPLVEVPNKYVYKGEMFFQVPLTKVSFNDINKPIKEILNAKNS